MVSAALLRQQRRCVACQSGERVLHALAVRLMTGGTIAGVDLRARGTPLEHVAVSLRTLRKQRKERSKSSPEPPNIRVANHSHPLCRIKPPSGFRSASGGARRLRSQAASRLAGEMRRRSGTDETTGLLPVAVSARMRMCHHVSDPLRPPSAIPSSRGRPSRSIAALLGPCVQGRATARRIGRRRGLVPARRDLPSQDTAPLQSKRGPHRGLRQEPARPEVPGPPVPHSRLFPRRRPTRR